MYIHCPDASYIPHVVNSEELSNFAQYGEGTVLHVVVHRLGDGVLDNEEYQNWIRSFGDHVHVRAAVHHRMLVITNAHVAYQHLIAAEEFSPNEAMFSSAAAAQLTLSDLDSEVFGPPLHSKQPHRLLSSSMSVDYLLPGFF